MSLPENSKPPVHNSCGDLPAPPPCPVSCPPLTLPPVTGCLSASAASASTAASAPTHHWHQAGHVHQATLVLLGQLLHHHLVHHGRSDLGGMARGRKEHGGVVWVVLPVRHSLMFNAPWNRAPMQPPWHSDLCAPSIRGPHPSERPLPTLHPLTSHKPLQDLSHSPLFTPSPLLDLLYPPLPTSFAQFLASPSLILTWPSGSLSLCASGTTCSVSSLRRKPRLMAQCADDWNTLARRHRAPLASHSLPPRCVDRNHASIADLLLW